MIIRSKAPTRISFAGGGTDTPPYCDEHGGCVVSGAINKYAYSTLESRPDQEIHIESGDFLKKVIFPGMDDIVYNKELDLLKAAVKKMNSRGMGLNLFMRMDVPPKAGLGGSAAAFVSLIGLFDHMNGKTMTNHEIAETALRLEREELKIPGGKQDQYAASFGGLNFIEFVNGHVRVNPLKIPKDSLLELEKHLVLGYLGDRKVEHGGDIISDQTKNVKAGNTNTLAAFEKTKNIALEMRGCLRSGDLIRFGELLHEGWMAKKNFSSMISNSDIDRVYDVARRNGAIGGKITGAGGGGFILFFCEPNKEHILTSKLNELNIKTAPVAFDFEGLQTWEVNYITGRSW